jgi:hypothetical protein
VDPRSGLDDLEKIKFLTLPGLELRTLAVQPVASGYTDYATAAAEVIGVVIEMLSKFRVHMFLSHQRKTLLI